MNRVKANYSYETVGNMLLIIDQNLGNMSVTNCIEDVVEEICQREMKDPTSLRIAYRDSEGIWDGWNHQSQTFFPIGARTQREAEDRLQAI